MEKTKRTLVFGASLKPYRASNIAVNKLKDSGEETIAFGPVPGEINGVQVQSHTEGLPEIDTISLYMSPARQRGFYRTIIELKPRRVIFNPGTENPEFYNLLVKDSIAFEEACTLTLLAIGQY